MGSTVILEELFSEASKAFDLAVFSCLEAEAVEVLEATFVVFLDSFDVELLEAPLEVVFVVSLLWLELLELLEAWLEVFVVLDVFCSKLFSDCLVSCEEVDFERVSLELEVVWVVFLVVMAVFLIQRFLRQSLKEIF